MSVKLYDKALHEALAEEEATHAAANRTHPAGIELIKAFAAEVLQLIKEGLLRDGIVRVYQFGTFRLKMQKARNGYNPQTGQRMRIPAHPRVVFTPAKALRMQVEQQVTTTAVQASTTAPRKPEPPPTSNPIAVTAPLYQADITPINPNAINREPSTQPDEDWTGHIHTTQVRSRSASTPLHADAGVVAPNISYRKPASDTSKFTRETRGEAPEKADSDYAMPPSSITPAPPTIPQSTRQSPASSSQKRTYYSLIAGIALLLLLSSLLLLWLWPAESPPPQFASDIKPTQQHVAQNEITPAKREPVAAQTILADNLPAENETPTLTAEPFFNERQHTIAFGDNLWKLAGKHYINPFLWPHIYQANPDAIKNPNVLQVSKILTLPRLEGHPNELSRIDRRHIAQGYMRLYLFYKKSDYQNAHYALIGVKWFDQEVLQENIDVIREADQTKLNAKRADNRLIEKAMRFGS